MECLKMDYRFTAILIIMITLLALFGGPAHSRNEYLNEYGARCGDFETRVEKEDRNNDYRHYSNNNNYDSDSENYRSKYKINFCRVYVADGREFIQTIS